MLKESVYKFLPYSKEKTKKLGEWIIANPEKAQGFVAVDHEGNIIGMMLVHITKYFFCDEKLCNDLLLYVDPAKRSSITVPIRLIRSATDWARAQGAREFCPGSSVAIASDRVEKLYNFMKFETVGHLFKMRLN